MRAVLFTIIIFSIAGCATQKDFYAIGGSRADGTVDLAYDLRQFEKPVVDYRQAAAIAKSKCGTWGYVDAEPFGGQYQTCNQRNGFGDCIAGQMIVKYQCIGDLDSPRTSTPSAGRTIAPPARAEANIGRWQYQAEKAGVTAECSTPALVNTGPGIELYTTTCQQIPSTIRCELSGCALQ